MVGLDQTRRILTRFAFFWGQADAAAMRRVFKWDDVLELIKAGPRLHAMQGVARWVTKSLDVDPEAGRFAMEVAWHGSAEAEEHQAAFGRAPQPACWMLAGYASGFMSFALGHDVFFVGERKEDIVPLARFFIDRLHDRLKLPNLRLSASCIDYLTTYSWPGNVRELENAIEHAAVLSRNSSITPELLPSNIVHGPAARPAGSGPLTLEQVEQEHIRSMLKESGGNRSRAAAALGISGATLWRRMKAMKL